MDTDFMSLYNYVFLTSYNPGKIFEVKKQANTLVVTKEIEVNRNFFEIIKNLDLPTNNVSYFVATGPGSYTGIRQTISFFIGFKASSKVENIYTFNLFDFVKVVHSGEYKKIILNGFPERKTVPYRGFVKDLETGDFSYFNDTNLPNDKNTLWIDTPQDSFTKGNIEVFLTKANKNIFSRDLTPLYINPVHITKSKHA